MIRFEHDGFQISCQRACWKRIDGVNTPGWNLEIKPFVARWIVQRENDTHMLGAIADRKPPWGVVGKGRCYCRLMLKLQKRKDVDQP